MRSKISDEPANRYWNEARVNSNKKEERWPVAADCDRHVFGRKIMTQTVLWIFLTLLHIVCCILAWIGIKTHFLNVKKYLIGIVVFVPFWGILCVLLIHLQRLMKSCLLYTSDAADDQ